jgi:hypothetical protein
MSDAKTQELGFLAKLVVGLAIVLFVAGVVWHGVTVATFERLWHDLIERPTQPMKFRFILQPSMAAIVAIRDGLKDARTGRSPFLVTVLRNPQKRIERLDEGLNATARIILLGLVMDTIYQIIVLQRFYPNEALIIAFLLAFVPYVIIRELVVRIRHDRASANR